MTRPKPDLWFRLPVGVHDAPTLAAHMQGVAARCAGPVDDLPQRALLETADLLDQCSPSAVACLRSVAAALDVRAARASEESTWGERRYWESLAHAVERIADSLAEAN